jgi:hypothetical protein
MDRDEQLTVPQPTSTESEVDRNKGVPARILDVPPTREELTAQVIGTRPKVICVSMALAEQREDVTSIAEGIAMLPSPIRPRILVGGFAVKFGLVSAIPGVDLVDDISALRSICLDTRT